MTAASRVSRPTALPCSARIHPPEANIGCRNGPWWILREAKPYSIEHDDNNNGDRQRLSAAVRFSRVYIKYPQVCLRLGAAATPATRIPPYVPYIKGTL